MKRYVSIDIGGTAIKYGVLNGDGELVCRSEMRTESYKGGMSILAKAVGIVERYCETGAVDGICISTAGMVDTEKGEIFYAAPLIPEYAGTRFKETMESRFGIPCEVENDVNCAGLAESVSGASKGSSSSLMLTIGTGIGGCAIIDGKVFHGFSNSACEVGYMHMAGSDFQTLGAAFKEGGGMEERAVGEVERLPYLSGCPERRRALYPGNRRDDGCAGPGDCQYLLCAEP